MLHEAALHNFESIHTSTVACFCVLESVHETEVHA